MTSRSATAILHALVQAVAPTMVGVSIGSWADRATWKVSYDPGNPPTPAQISAAQNVIAGFDPNGAQATAQDTFEQALAAGITLTWTVSTTLNDTYAIDEATQIRMLTERVSVAVNNAFTNGTTTLQWYGMTGTLHSMTMAQAGAFVKTVWQYLTALFVARATALGGGTPSWPLPNITITG